MKVNGSSNVFYVGEEYEQKVNPKLDRDDAVVFAGNLKFTSDTIEAKRKDAQEKALRVVGDAFDADKIIDEELKNRRTRVRELQDELSAAQNEINSLNKSKEDLRTSMGIEVDSEEQKDLELLEKREEAVKNGTYLDLSKEELNRLREIDEKGLTEYQEQALEINKAKSFYEEKADEFTKNISVENAAVRAIKQEMEKNTGMVKAEEQADKIMSVASDEIRSMLLDDVKKHIDEEAKEREEEAEKLAEANKDKKSEKDKLKITEEDLLKNAMKTDKLKEEVSVKNKVQSILDEAKLTVNEILGAAVDTNM